MMIGATDYEAEMVEGRLADWDYRDHDIRRAESTLRRKLLTDYSRLLLQSLQ